MRERGCSIGIPVSLLILATSCDVADPIEAMDDLDSDLLKDNAACSWIDWAILWSYIKKENLKLICLNIKIFVLSQKK